MRVGIEAPAVSNSACRVGTQCEAFKANNAERSVDKQRDNLQARPSRRSLSKINCPFSTEWQCNLQDVSCGAEKVQSPSARPLVARLCVRCGTVDIIHYFSYLVTVFPLKS